VVHVGVSFRHDADAVARRDWNLARLTTVLALVVGSGACADEPAPFEYRVLQARSEDNGHRQIVHESMFESYAAGLAAAPVTLVLMDATGDASIVIEVGICAEYECAGPIVEEELTVSIDPMYPDRVRAFQCVGVLGGVSGGIDATFHGACTGPD
jgi:hypothetical protein